MSALGQKQTFAVQNGMSALPPKADMCGATRRCPLCAKSGHSLAVILPRRSSPIKLCCHFQPARKYG